MTASVLEVYGAEGAGPCRFGILGPLQAHDDDGRLVDLGSAKLRVVLTLLLADAPRVVSLERLFEALWGGTRPPSASGTLQAYISNLRRLLRSAGTGGARLIVTSPPGYRIDVDPQDLDITLLPRLLAHAGELIATDQLAAAGRVLDHAVALWRGEPLVDLGESAAAVAERVRLGELHLLAVERRATVWTRLGRPDEAVAVLEPLVKEYPLRERLWIGLVEALYAGGRQAEALEACRACARTLRDELGLDVSAELRELQQAVLRQDPALSHVRVAGPADGTSRIVGRADELARIDLLLARAGQGTGGLLVLAGPAGSGRTTLAQEAATRASSRGLRVRRAVATGSTGSLVWAQLLRDLGQDTVAELLLTDPAPLDLDRAAELLAGAERALLVVEDVDQGGEAAVALLPQLASRLLSGTTAVLVTCTRPLGFGDELVVGGLDEDQLREMIPTLDATTARALRIATRGLPGPALRLSAGLQDAPDPLIHLALNAESTAEFLDVDHDLVRLIEQALDRDPEAPQRARLLARLAYELMGDQSASARRRTILAEATDLAARCGDAAIKAEVLDAKLHALWDPAGAMDRLAASDEIIALAGEGAHARRGMFWRFIALMELARVDEAERALSRFEREATSAADAYGLYMALARRAMLAAMRGRFDLASGLIDEVEATGLRLGLSETRRLVDTLRGTLGLERGEVDSAKAAVAMLTEYARRLPGQFVESTLARLLVVAGEIGAATSEMERVLPAVLAGAGPRWLGAVADLTVVAAAAQEPSAADRLYRALLPYAGRLVVLGGANSFMGPVDHYLALVAPDAATAVDHFSAAIVVEERIAALPWLARSHDERSAARLAAGDAAGAVADRERADKLAQRLGVRLLSRHRQPGRWSLRQDGDGWLLVAADEQARLPDARGLHYLRALLSVPAQEIAATELLAGRPSAPSSLGPVIDEAARATYRRRVEQLEAELDAADRSGDPQRAARAEDERAAVLAELRKATGIGGRLRVADPEGESARVNVTRSLRTAIERISVDAPRCAAHLSASIRTGRVCRYQPAGGGPAGWSV